MKKMFLLFSHTLTEDQQNNARSEFGIDQFIPLSAELQSIWSNIPADAIELHAILEPIKKFLREAFRAGDVALIQGDFGATCHLAHFVRELGGIGVYATTVRDVVEKEENGVIVKTSIFKHVRFRVFG
ncbi:MAG: CRISPR-associated protein Csx20 [Sulfuricurvum sp.]